MAESQGSISRQLLDRIKERLRNTPDDGTPAKAGAAPIEQSIHAEPSPPAGGITITGPWDPPGTPKIQGHTPAYTQFQKDGDSSSYVAHTAVMLSSNPPKHYYFKQGEGGKLEPMGFISVDQLYNSQGKDNGPATVNEPYNALTRDPDKLLQREPYRLPKDIDISTLQQHPVQRTEPYNHQQDRSPPPVNEPYHPKTDRSPDAVNEPYYPGQNGALGKSGADALAAAIRGLKDASPAQDHKIQEEAVRPNVPEQAQQGREAGTRGL